ncbi:sulfite exporter TauE/SafE family protein [Marinomonas sp. 5E14-1]|uniref:sulfite exporter TauE/SafE family protein n=1 Tax=Marinomonas sp. 5E14-1 TaxID=3153922 RepID=UPI00326726C6
MMLEWCLLLVLIGSGAGAVSSLIRCAPALIALPSFYFFLPLFDVSFAEVMLPVIATCLVAFIPAHLHAWIRSMQKGLVDFQHMINYAPGFAMGGIIGAQLLSLINFATFNIFFLLIAIIAILLMIFTLRSPQIAPRKTNRVAYIPVGLGLGVVSLLAGNCGRVMGQLLHVNSNNPEKNADGTILGFAIFTSIAAMVGFIYPAQPFDQFGLSGFVGAIHLPSLAVLAINYWFFYWLCYKRENNLDRVILYISAIVFLVCSLVRMWVS